MCVRGCAPCLRLLVVVWIEPNRVGTSSIDPSIRVQIVLRVSIINESGSRVMWALCGVGSAGPAEHGVGVSGAKVKV